MSEKHFYALLSVIFAAVSLYAPTWWICLAFLWIAFVFWRGLL